MPQKSYFPKVVAALRKTLSQLEESGFSRDEPKVLELKVAIVRAIAEREVRRESLAF